MIEQKTQTPTALVFFILSALMFWRVYGQSTPILTTNAPPTLAWDANSEPDIAGYRLHVINSISEEVKTIDVGNVTKYQTLDADLFRYATNVFRLSAYNLADLESELSQTAVFQGDTIHVHYMPPAPDIPVGLRIVGELQASYDGKTWKRIVSLDPLEFPRPRTEDRGLKTEDRGLKTED